MHALRYAHARVLQQIQSWPPGMQADFARSAALLTDLGPKLRVPHTHSLGTGLFELPVGGSEGDGHLLYALVENEIMLLDAFRGPGRVDRESPHATTALRRMAKARKAAKGQGPGRADTEYVPVPHDHAAFLATAAKQPGFDEAYAALEEGALIARALVAARVRAGLTQDEVAHRMGTSSSFVSRLEAADGRHSPTLGTLRKYAKAVGCDLKIQLVERTST